MQNFVENMQFTRRTSVFLIVFLFLRSIKADLRRCADFDPEIDVDPNQNEIDHFFESFNETNIDQTQKMFQLLNRIEMDEINRINFVSSSEAIRKVVSQLKKK